MKRQNDRAILPKKRHIKKQKKVAREDCIERLWGCEFIDYVDLYGTSITESLEENKEALMNVLPTRLAAQLEGAWPHEFLKVWAKIQRRVAREAYVESEDE